MKSSLTIQSHFLEKGQLRQFLGETSRKIAIITDSNVSPLYARSLIKKLQQSGYDTKEIIFPAGEPYKTQETVSTIQEALFAFGMDRDSLILAVGGGVVTDVAGFVAATFLRGIEWRCIPTTLLAMVDASVGGKCGVNTKYGKNLIGAIWQPTGILVDPAVLTTLTKDLFLEGVVEMLKHGAILDAHYFHQLVDCSSQMQQQDLTVLESMIQRSIEIKTAVVKEDERETKGKRRLLNFGHTVGHALECVSDYNLSHGNAVAIGMTIEASMAMHLGYLSHASFLELKDAFNQYGISTRLPDNIAKNQVIQAMQYDKKSKKGAPRFVMLQKIGSCHTSDDQYCSKVDVTIIAEALDDLCINQTSIS